MSWWNVDDKLLNLSLTHRLQVICDRVDMPVFAQRGCWLNDWPSPSDEFPKGTPQKLSLNNRIELQRVFEPRRQGKLGIDHFGFPGGNLGDSTRTASTHGSRSISAVSSIEQATRDAPPMQRVPNSR